MRLWQPAEIVRVTLHAGVDANATSAETRTLR